MLLILWSLGLVLCSYADAFTTPVGVAVFPPLQLPPRTSSVIGARLNLLLGVNESVVGFDLAAGGNMTDRSFGGIQLAGIFNRNKGPTNIYFAQIAGFSNYNLNTSDIYGLQLAGAFNSNHGKSTIIGLALAPFGNYAPQGTIGGVEVGLINRAKRVFGVQIGVVNVAEEVHGLQLGLVNVNKNGPLPVLPVMNFGF